MTSQCQCPANLEPLLMIEYPGFVLNPDRALATLGGMSELERVFAAQKDRLELRFRKSDPLAHPAYGDRVPKKCLVLRIRKLPAKEQQTKPQFELTLVGKIQTSFRFDTLAEFQWLPMQRKNLVEQVASAEQLLNGVTIKRTPESLNPQYVSILDDVLPIRNPFDNTLKCFNPDAPLLVLPAVFSRFDTAREIHQPHPKFRSKEMRDEFERQQSLSIIGRTRKKRSTMSYLLNFSDKIPERAHDKLVKERSVISPQERNLLPKLERCFELQKVWSKAALCYELNCSTIDIKYILPLIAFHYLTGPFRTMWVKYGYNPHQDKSSKVLQTLDFRVKSPHDQQQEYSRRSINQYQLPMRKNPEKNRNKQQLDLKSVISAGSSSSTAAPSASSSSQHPSSQHHLYQSTPSSSFSKTHLSFDEHMDESLMDTKSLAITEAMCKFRKNLAPAARQLSYQLKDIEIDEVQALVHANDGREPAECSERDGWLPDGSIDKIRKIMTKTLSDTVDTMTSQLEES